MKEFFHKHGRQALVVLCLVAILAYAFSRRGGSTAYVQNAAKTAPPQPVNMDFPTPRFDALDYQPEPYSRPGTRFPGPLVSPLDSPILNTAPGALYVVQAPSAQSCGC